MKPREKMQWHLDRILILKEKLDCAHVKESAKHGCHCRRCKTARNCLTSEKT